MSKDVEIKSNRERQLERLKAKYPDKDFPDDEALFGQIVEDYDGYDKELSGYREREKSISDLLASDHRSASFLIDWLNGEDPIVSLVRKFGDDFKEALEDPEKQEALAAANKEYAERIARDAQYEGEYQRNITETLATLEALQADEGLSDADIDSAMDFLVDIMRNGLLGKFSRESITMALKAIRHDTDVEQADREGEVRGRNAKIEEKLRRVRESDGTANIGSRHGGMTSADGMPHLGAIDQNYGSQSIWERGGERRRSIK